MTAISQAVGASPYPGRGILAGKSADGKLAVFAYFIMGRSENSRNRVFVAEPDGLRTRAHDPAKMRDPSLVIYRPVYRHKNVLIISNGDQTETVREYLLEGKTFYEALNTRTFEPDAPNFTPRISAMATFHDGGFSLQMSILKSADPQGRRSLRAYFLYEGMDPGEGLFLHTYRGDGDPLPSFEGEPEKVAFGYDPQAILSEIWDNLDPSNRVSLWMEARDLATGMIQTFIINRNEA